MAKVRINKERCKGCGLCVAVCARKNLKTGEALNAYGAFAVVAVCEDDCTGCGMCYVMCPEACVEIIHE
ncbi:MAG: 4Fe-4S binding protein [Deltaproteobacteria bacterium]